MSSPTEKSLETKPKLLRAMLGTAGHVDHGKTSLVRALTSFETDTLKEEKERGLTIDFGVAPCTLEIAGEPRVFGIIDVPGHKDFIRNMVAGASSIDLLLLVVAADDSLMPQTREHLRIARYLGVSKLLIVISKIDLVDAETIAFVEEEVTDFVKDCGFSSAELFKVSNTSGEGIAELREGIIQELTPIAQQEESRESYGFRMFVRKAFTMKGYGTVVTGVPDRGVLREGERLEMVPGNKEVGVRALQNYRSNQKEISFNVSAAVNVRDLSPEDFSRGSTLVQPGIFQQSFSAVVSLRNDTDKPRFTKRGRYRMHIGTSALVVDVRTVSSEEVAPNESGYLIIRFRNPQTFAVGDRFLLRELSPALTIGGGEIISLRTGVSDDKADNLKSLEFASIQMKAKRFALAAAIAEPSAVIDVGVIAKVSGMPLPEAKKELADRPKLELLSEDSEETETLKLLKLNAETYLNLAKTEKILTLLLRQLRRYHKSNPLSLGMKTSYAADLLGLPAKSFDSIWKEVPGKEQVSFRNGVLALADFKPELSEREGRLREAIVAAVEKTETKSLAKGPLFETLKVSEKEGKTVLKILSDAGEIQLFGSTLMMKVALEEVEAKLLEHFGKSPKLELADFRKMTSLGRNLAVEILEHFDSKGLTKREGSFRVLNRAKSI